MSPKAPWPEKHDRLQPRIEYKYEGVSCPARKDTRVLGSAERGRAVALFLPLLPARGGEGAGEEGRGDEGLALSSPSMTASDSPHERIYAVIRRVPRGRVA